MIVHCLEWIIFDLTLHIQDKKDRLERVKQTYQSVHHQMKTEYSRTDSLDARAKQLESYHKQEELRNRSIDKELADLKQQIFKHSQEIFRLKQQESNLTSEINGSQAAAKNMQSKIHKLDAESMKQMELVYNQEYLLYAHLRANSIIRNSRSH